MTDKTRNNGFTLVELVTVILVLAIVSVGVTSYLKLGIDIYSDTVGRDRQIGDSRYLIERITREVREALPNSVRISDDGSCLEFVPILASSSYVEIPVAPDTESNTVRLVQPEVSAGNKIVVYPLTTAEVYVDPTSASGKVFSLAGLPPAAAANPPVDDSVADVTLANTVVFAQDSPTERYFLVSNAISYCVSGSDINRYDGYWPIGSQTTPSVTGSLMAQRQSNPAPFTYNSDTLTRNAMVQLDFKFSYGDELLELYHEVHIVNVP